MASEDGGEEKVPKMGWADILALTIAAYQLILPVLAALVGAVVVVYLLIRLWMH